MVEGNRGGVDGVSARGRGRCVILSVRRGLVIDLAPAVVVRLGLSYFLVC
jgi:hypothetical protein